MTAAGIAISDQRPRTPLQRMRRWKLWSVPTRALTVILVVDFVALMMFTAAALDSTLSGGDLRVTVALLLLGCLFNELTTRIYRIRKYLAGGAVINMNSVWGMAAILLLPAIYAAVLVIILSATTNLRTAGRAVRPHRMIFSIATGVVAVATAEMAATSIQPRIHELVPGVSTALAVVAAAGIYFVLNTVVVLATVYLAMSPLPFRDVLPDPHEVGLEIGTLLLGVFTAQMVVELAWLTSLIVVPMFLLQRSSLVSQLQVAATTDTKTGLLNATAWQELAQRELLRAKRDESPCAVMLLDLDHFKRVNDTLGHLSGDRALKAVADVLKKELRGYDAVARFGGEEFVVFLNDLTIDDARQVAKRTLERVRALIVTGQDQGGRHCTLTASIGLSAYPEHGSDLTDLLEAADVALYGAKRDGRDRVGEPRWGVDEHAGL